MLHCTISRYASKTHIRFWKQWNGKSTSNKTKRIQSPAICVVVAREHSFRFPLQARLHTLLLWGFVYVAQLRDHPPPPLDCNCISNRSNAKHRTFKSSCQRFITNQIHPGYTHHPVHTLPASHQIMAGQRRSDSSNALPPVVHCMKQKYGGGGDDPLGAIIK